MTGITEAFLTTVLGGAVFLAIVSCFPELLGLIHRWLASLEPQSQEGERSPSPKMGIGRADIIIAAMCLIFGIACEAGCDFIYEKTKFGGWAAVEALTSGQNLSPIGSQIKFKSTEILANSMPPEDLDMIKTQLASPECLTRSKAQLLYFTAKNWFVTHAEGASELTWARRRVILERSTAIMFLAIGLLRLGMFIWVACVHRGCRLQGIRAATSTVLIGVCMGLLYCHEEIDYNQSVLGTFASEASRALDVRATEGEHNQETTSTTPKAESADPIAPVPSEEQRKE